jgi:basic membrane lipoprotein Med (substrate-binding protein (PBP1-ABC) superfamily)
VNAFQLGALSVNPNVTTQVIVNNTWVDPAKEAEAVNALADNGVDVVTMIVDSPAAVIQTAEQRGVMSMGFHCLCAQSAAGDHWLTGIGFTWGPLFTKIAQSVIDKTWVSSNDVGSLASGYAQLAPYGPLVSEETKALVEKTKLGLTSGDVQVFKGPIYDNTGQLRIPEGQVGSFEESLQNTNWLVQGVTGQIG